MKKAWADMLKRITTTLKVWDKLTLEQRVELIKLNHKFEMESGSETHALYTESGGKIKTEPILLAYIEKLEKGLR